MRTPSQHDADAATPARSHAASPLRTSRDLPFRFSLHSPIRAMRPDKTPPTRFGLALAITMSASALASAWPVLCAAAVDEAPLLVVGFFLSIASAWVARGLKHVIRQPRPPDQTMSEYGAFGWKRAQPKAKSPHGMPSTHCWCVACPRLLSGSHERGGLSPIGTRLS